ncbi:7-carboxy-7-deazaguanine synthase QueE [Conchiformibius kuhniae]|uniref:7-carboxy-7-deazaguanine synthase n=1 Tax=Conchiformibius kuhniae TaxID=211502 RepID=A0A8T9MWA6_9NEIS|nr:7-carboxy-7-deazaguanine synthase QueE [Conchiformibius kuhniae]UOP04708.1 7-carboxy-7-deazaguanine synthase QueE [Conchiformibius kuhniae]
MMPHYRIVEIFETLQGEGWNTGMPAVFVRFGKCNLACPWCDTDYHRFGMMTLTQIVAQVRRFSAPNIVITGGEPTIQPHLPVLLDTLKAEGYFLAIETNGIKAVPAQIDYTAASPKRLYRDVYRKRALACADEIRIVTDGTPEELFDFCQEIEQTIDAPRHYLSPCERAGEMNILETITLLGKLNARPDAPHWQLSLQTHKLAGID